MCQAIYYQLFIALAQHMVGFKAHALIILKEIPEGLISFQVSFSKSESPTLKEVNC